jgi:hypothetical protein
MTISFTQDISDLGGMDGERVYDNLKVLCGEHRSISSSSGGVGSRTSSSSRQRNSSSSSSDITSSGRQDPHDSGGNGSRISRKRTGCGIGQRDSSSSSSSKRKVRVSHQSDSSRNSASDISPSGRQDHRGTGDSSGGGSSSADDIVLWDGECDGSDSKDCVIV